MWTWTLGVFSTRSRDDGASQNFRGVGNSVKFLSQQRARVARKRNEPPAEGGPRFFAAKVLIASPRSERRLRQRVRAENGKALADQRHYANSESELV